MPEENHRSGSIYGGVADPVSVVLFGASGDLAKRKVIPAMFNAPARNVYLSASVKLSPLESRISAASAGTMAVTRTDCTGRR